MAWFYAHATTHKTYTTVRGTLVLTTFLTFTTFILFPCAPPRLLPLEYGFQDPASAATATSVWTADVTLYSAIPSLYFAYAIIVGCALVHHSSIFRSHLHPTETKKSRLAKPAFVAVGIAWPVLSLLAGVATGNEFFLGAWGSLVLVVVAGIGNRIVLLGLPFRDFLFWGVGIDDACVDERV